MALTERLAVILDAHAGGLISEFQKAAGSAEKLEQKTKAAAKGTEDVGTSAGKTGGLLGSLADKAGVSGNVMKVALGAVGVAAVGLLGDAVLGAVEKFEHLAGAVHDFQLVSGASAEDASKLLNVVHALGIDPAAADKAFFLLGKSIGNNKSKLDDFGVAIAKNKDGSTNLVGTLGNVAEAYQKSGDAAERDALSAAAFGKGAAALLPLLSLTKEQLTALGNRGPVFSEKDIENAHTLEVLTRAFGQDVEKYKAKAGGFFAEHALEFAGGVGKIEEFLHIIPQGAALSGLAARDMAAETTILGEKAQQAAEDLEKEHKATIDLRDGLIASQDAQTAYERAVQGVGDAERNAADKRKTLNDLLKAGAVDLKAVDQATRSLDQANRSLASAQDRAADAKKKLDAALAGPAADDLAGAQLDLKDATLGVADAQDNLTTAQQAVNDAQAAGDPVALAKANRDLQHATLDLEHATRNQAAAQKALNDLDPTSEAGAGRIADAYLGLADANQAVDDANRKVWDSTVALNTARAGDPDFADKLATAYLGVRDANNGVADAQKNELTAILNLEDARYRQAALLGAGGDAAERLSGLLDGLASQYPAIAPLLAGLLGGTGAATPASHGSSDPNAFGANAPRPAGVQGPTLAAPTPFGATAPRPAGVQGPTLAGARARGGRVEAGKTYLVGEDGPEPFTPSLNGYITPNGAAGGTTNITINMPPNSDGDDVVAALRRYKQRNGSLPI